MKSIKQIIKSERVNMGGIMLDQPLPNKFMDKVDPFLLIHHWDHKIEGGKKQKDLGVGPHPHRGFSPVTLIFKGGVHHRDSFGNNSIVMQGGTQWMFAGHGITHSERPVNELAENGGEFEFIQFWVNVPAKNKMNKPYYIPVDSESMPAYSTKDNKVKVGVVSGEFNDVKGFVDTFSPVTTLRFEFEKDGTIEFEISKDHNCLLYNLKGELVVNSKENVSSKEMVLFANDDDKIKIEAKEKSSAIILAGEPINEEVASYGPFVMNNNQQIMEAVRDAQIGKMGMLIEEF